MLLLVVSALVAWRGEVMDWIPRLNNCIIHDPTETVSCGCIFTFVQLLFFYVTHVFLDLFFDPTATQVHLCFLFVGHCDSLIYSVGSWVKNIVGKNLNLRINFKPYPRGPPN